MISLKLLSMHKNIRVVNNSSIRKQCCPCIFFHSVQKGYYNSNYEEKQKERKYSGLNLVGLGVIGSVGLCITYFYREYKRNLLRNASRHRYLNSTNLLTVICQFKQLFTVSAASISDPPNQPPKDTKSLRQKFNFVADVVEKCGNSVVYIEIRDTRR